MNTQKQTDFNLWCDFIERDFLESQFKDLINKCHIQGATSNPSIFANSILNSPAYKSQILSLKGEKPKKVYESLALEDIKKAANMLRPLWEKNKDEGYISIEIDPLLCENASKSIDEGKRLFKTLNEPNVMIKVPATQAGYEVMNELFSNNIPINATLIFSPTQAKTCSDIFKTAKKYSSCTQNRAVISVFVSRFDRIIDPLLEKTPQKKAKIGILNAMHCYHLIETNEDEFTRTLFASTGVKGNDLPKEYYIKSLLLPHCVNTAPLDSIKAYYQTSPHSFKHLPSLNEINTQIQEIIQDKISLESLYESLMKEGLEAFIKSFENLLASI